MAVCDSVMQSTGDSGCQAVAPYPGFVFMCNDKLVFGLVFLYPLGASSDYGGVYCLSHAYFIFHEC